MTTRCSNCGRIAVFQTAKNRKRRASADHDLCERCWRDAVHSVQNRERVPDSHPIERHTFQPLAYYVAKAGDCRRLEPREAAP